MIADRVSYVDSADAAYLTYAQDEAQYVCSLSQAAAQAEAATTLAGDEATREGQRANAENA